jgi:hypothetical protein
MGDVDADIDDLETAAGEDRFEAAGKNWFVGCNENAHY